MTLACSCGLCSSRPPVAGFCPENWLCGVSESAMLGGLGGLSATYRICSFHFPTSSVKLSERHSGIAANRAKSGQGPKAASYFRYTRQNQTRVLFPDEDLRHKKPATGGPARRLACSSSPALLQPRRAASKDGFRKYGYILCATDAAAREINCRYTSCRAGLLVHHPQRLCP
jgi:hypothetical protein